MRRDDPRRKAIGLTGHLIVAAMRVSSAGVLELAEVDDGEAPLAMLLNPGEFVLVHVLTDGALTVAVGPIMDDELELDDVDGEVLA